MEYLGYVVILALTALIYYAPRLLRGYASRRAFFSECADRFFEISQVIVKDERTPEGIVSFLQWTGQTLDDPNVVRRVVWRALIGRMREDFRRPPPGMRAFMKLVENLPKDLGERFAEAVSYGMVANAMSAGILGEIFLRFLLVDPRQKETANRLAAEVALTADMAPAPPQLAACA